MPKWPRHLASGFFIHRSVWCRSCCRGSLWSPNWRCGFPASSGSWS